METKFFGQIIIKHNNKILLQRRLNTGYYDDYLTLPGGHVESNETVLNCVCREVKEELNLDISENMLKLYCIIDRQNPDKTKRYINLIFTLKSENINLNNIHNNEPDKCSELVYCESDKLQNDVIPYIKIILQDNTDYLHYIEE